MAIVGGLALAANLFVAVVGGANSSRSDPGTAVGMTFFLVLALAGGVGLGAAFCLMQLRAYVFCIIGCFALMLGGLVCLAAGPAVGVWALVVLARREVRAAFR